jgi:hypothetical protein
MAGPAPRLAYLCCAVPRLVAPLLLALSPPLPAHESGRKDVKPTKAQPDLRLSERQLNKAKKELAAQGRYSCCVRPSCDLCARKNGSCNCARNVAAGRGACGECYAAWLAGRGSLKGVDPKSVTLLPSANQACPLPNAATPPPELRDAEESLLRAKRILVSEKRFSCCIRGGCAHCAREANCSCGRDLASVAGASNAKAARKGVCGDCLDGWRSGQGSFAGVSPEEVSLEAMDSMDALMGPGGGASSGWYSSGTSQEPRATPMDMLSRKLGDWTLMLNGVLFGVYSAETGPRGRDKIFSTNWFMGMASRRLGPGTLTFRSMLSLEPATITDRRYPLLFADGETAYGVPIISGQHPHSFFMELAAAYQIKLGERAALNLYGGPRGEPALGPPAFPHRISSSEDPVAVISHHLQDSTHIASNVFTAGITYRAFTWEVSGFHGREPGENRWALDDGGIDSFSTRLTITPTDRWSAQVSVGRINKREATHPLRPSLRSTASVMYVRPLQQGHWATSLIWGRNVDLSYTQLPNVPPQPITAKSTLGRSAGLESTEPLAFRPQHIVSVPTRIPRQIYNSFLAESTLFFHNRNWLWMRAEAADKDSLLIYEEDPFVLLADERRYARVHAYTAGYERELPRWVDWLGQGVGAQVTSFVSPPVLEPVYGPHPWGIQFFVRLRLGNRLY